MAAIIEVGPDPWRRHQDPACDDITVFWIPLYEERLPWLDHPTRRPTPPH
jgi:hypothetical protein